MVRKLKVQFAGTLYLPREQNKFAMSSSMVTTAGIAQNLYPMMYVSPWLFEVQLISVNFKNFLISCHLELEEMFAN